MPDLSEILKQIQRDLCCPICGQKYEISQIKFRGAFEQVLVIQTTCNDGHLTLFMTFFPEKIQKEEKPAITSDELKTLQNKLKTFNGDFEKQWKKIPKN